MLVSDYVSVARKRLVVVEPDLGIRETAEKLAQPSIDLVVIADARFVLGVITDNDIVAWAATDHQAISAPASAGSLMSRDVFLSSRSGLGCRRERSSVASLQTFSDHR